VADGKVQHASDERVEPVARFASGSRGCVQGGGQGVGMQSKQALEERVTDLGDDDLQMSRQRIPGFAYRSVTSGSSRMFARKRAARRTASSLDRQAGERAAFSPELIELIQDCRPLPVAVSSVR
jgi:hypothetical protein